MEKLLEHLGYATPFIYAAAAYGLFAWLDKEASDDAKAALAGTMNLMDYDKKRIASALVVVFDRLYAYPLLRWRAFFRSMLFTLAVSGFFIFETRASLIQINQAPIQTGTELALFTFTNILSDYFSLFLIRAQL